MNSTAKTTTEAPAGQPAGAPRPYAMQSVIDAADAFDRTRCSCAVYPDYRALDRGCPIHGDAAEARRRERAS